MREWSVDEDTILLNIMRTGTVETACIKLSRPAKAIEARIEYLRGKKIISGSGGDMVMSSSTSNTNGMGDPSKWHSASGRKTMERTLYTQNI